MRLLHSYVNSFRFLRFINSSISPASQKTKRFYKRVDVQRVCCEEKPSLGLGECFEIRLDGQKLRSPVGRDLQLPKQLALLIAQEWESQETEIRKESMHITGLSFTCIDNPFNETKNSLIRNLLTFLQTDTVLYFADPKNSLNEEQQQFWSPLIRWANSHFGLSLCPSETATDLPFIPPETIINLEKHLHSHNFPSLVGINYATESIKSLLITLAALSQQIDVETAVKLARLEQIHQTKRWGSVEWAHDIEHFEERARLSAAILFSICHLPKTE